MLPHLAKVADDIAIVKSVHTDQFNHAPAQIFVNTGSSLPGRPSMGSWVTYGLGQRGRRPPRLRRPLLGRRDQRRRRPTGRAASCPPPIRACRSGRRATRSSTSPARAGVDPRLQRDTIDLVRGLNRRHLDAVGDPEIEARIAAYELAYRMQTSAPS